MVHCGEEEYHEEEGVRHGKRLQQKMEGQLGVFAPLYERADIVFGPTFLATTNRPALLRFIMLDKFIAM
jgi:hypothetical protein